MMGFSLLELFGFFSAGVCFFCGLCISLDLLVKMTWKRVSTNATYVFEFMRWCKANKGLTFRQQFAIKRSLSNGDE